MQVPSASLKISNIDKKNIFGILAGDLLGQGINFVITILVAIHFGPTIFGMVSHGNAIASCMAIVVAFGIPQILSRDIVQNKFDSSRLIATSLLLRVVIAIVANTALIAFIWIEINDPTERYIVLILSLAATLGLFNLDQSYDALRRSFAHAILRLCAFNLTYLAAIGLVVWLMPESNILWIVASLLFAATVFALANVTYFNARVLPLNWQFDRKIAGYLITHALPTLFTSTLSVIYLNFAVLYLRQSGGLETAADFNAAYRLILILLLLDVAVSRVFVPKISGLREKASDAPVTLRRIFLIRLGYLSVLAVTAWLFASPLVNLVYQDTYPDAAPLLQLLAIWIVGTSLNHLGTYLYTNGAMTQFAVWIFIKFVLLLLYTAVFSAQDHAVIYALIAAEYSAAAIVLLLGMRQVRINLAN